LGVPVIATRLLPSITWFTTNLPPLCGYFATQEFSAARKLVYSGRGYCQVATLIGETVICIKSERGRIVQHNLKNKEPSPVGRGFFAMGQKRRLICPV
jgi:hypothetical protein